MITGAHVALYSHDARAYRGFVRDVLGIDGVDAGDGWLSFALPPPEHCTQPTERSHTSGVSCATTSDRPSPTSPPGVCTTTQIPATPHTPDP